jgi:hypothetical protein
LHTEHTLALMHAMMIQFSTWCFQVSSSSFLLRKDITSDVKTLKNKLKPTFEMKNMK